ncbi:hypothetical protein PM082_017407 [Marasmius tenuissimus]|nr:hypothetical protein PM082_017407 [Marasmius tenuissimus]
MLSIVFQLLDVKELDLSGENPSIVIFGITGSGTTVCIHVKDLSPSHKFYCRLPPSVPLPSKGQISNYFNIKLGQSESQFKQIEVVCSFGAYAYLEFEGISGSTFNLVRNLGVHEYGRVQFRPEHFVGPEAGFMADMRLTGMQWIEIPTEKSTPVAEEENISTCQIELHLSYSDFQSHADSVATGWFEFEPVWGWFKPV